MHRLRLHFKFFNIQFTADETNSGSTSLTIRGEDIDKALTFSNTSNNISNRTTTTAAVAWNDIPAWNTVGESNANQRTPDLTSIVQEIINRVGWTSGNPMAFVINGSGERTAESFNGDSARAAILTITADFSLDPIPAIVTNLNRGLPFIYFIADNSPELFSVAPNPAATPLPFPTSTNVTLGGAPIVFTGEGGGFRSTDQLIYVFDDDTIGNDLTESSDMYSIDPTTGVANLVKTDIVLGHVQGAEFYINNATGEEILFIVYRNGTEGGPDRLTAINPNPNGTIPAWTAYSGYPVVLSGTLTVADGISWDPDTSEFYVQNDDNVDYHTVDVTTGVTTFAFTTSLAIDGEGITYASDGTNYIEDEGSAGQGRTIFIVDTETGNLIPAAQLGSTGDVESIMGNLGVRNDSGDAPSSYGYAAHLLPVLSSSPLAIYMGTVAPDSEDPFLNFSIGNSDDNTGDDEDGVTSDGLDLTNQFLFRGQTKTIDITTNGAGVLNAWIDFNRDGDFEDTGEQIATDVAPSSGNITLNVSISPTATEGTTYARFRFSSETGLIAGNSEAIDGEVEDYRLTIIDELICGSGSVLAETISFNSVNATAVIVDNSVNSQNNALGNDDGTTALFNNDNDELVLEMGESINTGDEVVVNGADGNQFNIWVSSSSTGPWTPVGSNAPLDFTFTSPIDWLFIRFRRAVGSANVNLSFVDASKSTSTFMCVPDNDNDGVSDTNDLDDDNDGILDTIERAKTVLWVTQNTPETEEQNTIDKLMALGYTVTVVDDSVGGNANDYAVTFLYEDVNSGTALANVANLTTTTNGVVTTENALFDDILGTTGTTANTNTNIINITDNTHPITLGLPLANLDVGDAGFHVNNIVSGTKLGFHPNGQAVLIAWELGDALDTGIAPGRRSVLPLTNSTGGFNANGEDLLVNAITWTAGIDTDKDGIEDCLDTDSDDDGCFDANEAYADSNTDSNGDGTFGGVITSIEVNDNGLVISAGINGTGDAYSTTPAISTISSQFTFQEIGTIPTIILEPTNQHVFLLLTMVQNTLVQQPIH